MVSGVTVSSTATILNIGIDVPFVIGVNMDNYQLFKERNNIKNTRYNYSYKGLWYCVRNDNLLYVETLN